MEIPRITWQLLSGMLALIPICAGLRAFPKDKILAGAVILFLSVGVLTDYMMWRIVRSGSIGIATRVFQYYSLFEAFFFLWCVRRLTISAPIKKLAYKLMFVMPGLWMVLMIAIPMMFSQFNQGSAVFDFFYEVIVSFLAGFALLALAEKSEAILDLPEFWILLTIFVYCFGTFFIMAFVKSFLSQRIWFINNIVNVISYCLYTIGLHRLYVSGSVEE